jgi:hypothetical protein
VLLIVALFIAYRAWTAEDEKERDTGDVVVWNEPASAFESLTFTAKNKKVVVERRKDEGGQYLWGTVERTRKKVVRPTTPVGHPPTGPADDGGDPHGADDGHGHGAAPATPGGAPAGGAATPTPTPAPAPAKKAAPAPAKAPAKKAAPAPAKAPAKKAAPSPANKAAPAKKADGDKANQNDPIKPGDKSAAGNADPAKAKPAGAKPGEAKPAAAPAKADDKGAGDEASAAGAGGEAAKADEAPAAAPATPAAPGAVTTDEAETTVRQFPVGEAGDELVADFSRLRALRELGSLDDEARLEYGLAKVEEHLLVKFAGGKERKLLVGDRVFGGSERYVLDESTGKGYVLSAEVMRHVDAAETALGLKEYHQFDMAEDLERLAVEVEGTVQVLVRLELENDDVENPDAPKTRTTWARAETSHEEDVTMANFVDRVSKLRPIEYLPDLDRATLTRLARFSYQDDSGKELGFMELFKGKAPEPTPAAGAEPEAEYYMVTERTRVLGRVSRLTAERVDNDLAEVFGGFSGTDPAAPDPAPAPPAPAPPAPAP